MTASWLARSHLTDLLSYLMQQLLQQGEAALSVKELLKKPLELYCQVLHFRAFLEMFLGFTSSLLVRSSKDR